MDDKVSTVQIKVDGLECVQSMLDELNTHIQAVESIIDELKEVELDIRAVIPQDGIQVHS